MGQWLSLTQTPEATELLILRHLEMEQLMTRVPTYLLEGSVPVGFINLTQTKDIWEEGTSVEEDVPSD